jgi:general stress protein 26
MPAGLRKLSRPVGLRRASLVAALLVLAVCAPARSQTPARAEIVTAAREIMKAARYAALVTNGRDGQPQARVVDPFEPDSNLNILIATNALTRKVGEIEADARVTLLYFNAGQEYVTVLGTAQLISDPAEKSKHWKEDWTPFYKDGPRGEDYLLIRVRPERLEVVSPERGILNDATTWRPATVDLRN